MTKQWGPGVDALKRGIQLNPDQPTYYNNLAAASRAATPSMSALAALDGEKLLDERLNSATVWYTLGNGYALLTHPNNAIATYRQLLAPDSAAEQHRQGHERHAHALLHAPRGTDCIRQQTSLPPSPPARINLNAPEKADCGRGRDL